MIGPLQLCCEHGVLITSPLATFPTEDLSPGGYNLTQAPLSGKVPVPNPNPTKPHCSIYASLKHEYAVMKWAL